MKTRNAGQKIAVTVWEHRVSPVFDSARTLLIAEIQEDALISTSFLTFDPDRPLELVQLLQAQMIVTLICGAISEGPASMLEAAGIELISFIAGDVHRVLATILQGGPLGAQFKMPGCGKNICCRVKIRHGWEIDTQRSNGRQRRGQEPQSVPVGTKTDESTMGSAISAEMAVRVSGKS